MRRRLKPILFLVAVAVLAFFAYSWLAAGLQPTAPGAPFYVRYEQNRRLPAVLEQLKAKGVVRNPKAWRVYALLNRRSTVVGTGTYMFRPGMSADQVLDELQKPIRQMVRIPETNWAQRTANLLEQKDVLKSDEYMALVKSPSQFKDEVSFTLPEGSLEGYLYPDTYDLPPLIGAERTVRRQLRTFEQKVIKEIGTPENLHELIIKASLVELETGTEKDRAMIAGVIENRIKKKMRLQIDATILYGMQEWRRLTFRDYREQKNPYNTYLIDGLPPGPICSPSLNSIRAAMEPAEHNYLYYVALPDGTSIYAATYPEHLRNIERRKAALREREKESRR